MKDPLIFDVIIIGAGAAGLFAATAAAERNRKTLLLEKNSKIGVKILMSGGTRCNITQDTDPAGIVQAFGRKGKFLHSALSRLAPADVVEWVQNEGVPTKTESTGKIFPASDRAIDVRNALLGRLQRSPNVSIQTQAAVTDVLRNNGLFHVAAGSKDWIGKKLVITTGGKSYPGCGTTGDGYQWSVAMGHTIVETVPALTPVVCSEQWVKDLKGITIEDCRVGVFYSRDVSRISAKNFEKLSLAARRSSLLFTHFGLSGPAVLDVSKEIAYRPNADINLVIDLLPSEKEESLIAIFASRESQSRSPSQLLNRELPVRLLQKLCENAGIQPNQRIAELRRPLIQALIRSLKCLPIAIESTRGYKKAEVTAGGVNLKEVNSQTMESKLCDGLYFAGEVLDLDGPIGGFNFQSAFSTGFLAGLNI